MNINERVQDYLEAATGIAEAHTHLTMQVRDYGLSLSDLDHFLELEELSPDEVARITLMRKSLLAERRNAKDNICVIDCILPKQVEGRTTMDRYNHAVHGLGERVYTPRQLVLSEILERET